MDKYLKKLKTGDKLSIATLREKTVKSEKQEAVFSEALLLIKQGVVNWPDQSIEVRHDTSTAKRPKKTSKGKNNDANHNHFCAEFFQYSNENILATEREPTIKVAENLSKVKATESDTDSYNSEDDSSLSFMQKV